MRQQLTLPFLAILVAGCGETTAPIAEPRFRIGARSLEFAEGRFVEVALSTNLTEYQVIGQVNWYYRSDPPSDAVRITTPILGRWPWNAIVDGFGPTEGYVVVQHSSRELVDSIPVLVHPVSVAAVNFVPAADTIAVGESTMIDGSVEDSVGVQLQRQVEWTSSDSAIATIEYQPGGGYSSALNRVWGMAPGQATISGTVEGVTSEFTVVVTGP